MKTLTVGLVAVLGGMSVLLAQEDPPEKLNLDEIDGLLVSETVIPIPLEIFKSLDKLGQQNWGGIVDNRQIKLNPNRSRSALLFGLVVSDGFIAVQAQDKKAVQDIGREVLNLSNVLGVRADVQEHANAIIASANNEEWGAVRRELDRTRQTVLNRMKQMRDDDLATLASLGGWLGGTKALARILEANFDQEGSDLLNQPELVKQLKEDFDALPAAAKNGSVFLKVGETLISLEGLMKADDDGAISKQNVEQISAKATDLVDAIYESS